MWLHVLSDIVFLGMVLWEPEICTPVDKKIQTCSVMVKTVVQSINNLIKPHVIEGHGNFSRSELLLYLGNVLLATWWCTCTFQQRGNGIFQKNHRRKFDIRRRSGGLAHVVT